MTSKRERSNITLYLLRVGADKTYGGFHAPILADRTYRFIPIPEEVSRQDGTGGYLTYADYQWNGQPIVEYLPARKRDQLLSTPIHMDPEFVTCTYGSPRMAKKRTEKNYAKLAAMEAGSILVFYAAFQGPADTQGHDLDGYYAFAYFIVQQAIPFDTPGDLPESEAQLVRNNHHVIQQWPNQVVVVGNPAESRVFEKAVLLSLKSRDRAGSNYYPGPEVRALLKYDKSLNMSSLRAFDDQALQDQFKQYLDSRSGANLFYPGGDQIHPLAARPGSRADLTARLRRALTRLCEKDGPLLEPEIPAISSAHRLAHYLQDEFGTEFTVDVEFPRLFPRDEGSRDPLTRPMIVVHKRGRDLNLLLLEFGKQPRPQPEPVSSVLSDFTGNAATSFAWGARVVVDSERKTPRSTLIEWYAKGKKMHS